MDFRVKHWAPFPRRFPAPFPVEAFAAIPSKTSWVQRRFGSCNFSLILRGRGEFRRRGRQWEVEAPCVITQWPGEAVEYGPAEGTGWSELYLIYAARLMPRFRQCGFVDPERPLWPIAHLAAVEEEIARLRVLAATSAPESVVDRVDRVCERLLLETLQPPPPLAGESGDETAVAGLIAQVRRDLRAFVSLEEAASRNGMSLSTFRRRWKALYATPPARFLRQLRLREACRRLAETREPIRGIAHAVGFDDELYFSRCFRKEIGVPPREYRKAHRLHAAAPAS